MQGLNNGKYLVNSTHTINDHTKNCHMCFLVVFLGGIVLFAATTMVMHALKLGYFVGYSECLPIIEGIYPVTHNVHTFFQVCNKRRFLTGFSWLCYTNYSVKVVKIKHLAQSVYKYKKLKFNILHSPYVWWFYLFLFFFQIF